MKTRNEMNPEYTWDLSHIFKNKEAWEEYCKKAESAIELVATAQGTLSDSAEALKNGIKLMCDAVDALAKTKSGFDDKRDSRLGE